MPAILLLYRGAVRAGRGWPATLLPGYGVPIDLAGILVTVVVAMIVMMVLVRIAVVGRRAGQRWRGGIVVEGGRGQETQAAHVGLAGCIAAAL